MQHLLDFIQEHTLEEQLYFVAQRAGEELEVLWRRGERGDHWQIRPKCCEGPWELVPRNTLIEALSARGVDMAGVKNELHSLLAIQIAFADMVLRDANQQLGSDVVERFVIGQQGFLEELHRAVEQLTIGARPSMVVVEGGGAQTTVREGHLSLVR